MGNSSLLKNGENKIMAKKLILHRKGKIKIIAQGYSWKSLFFGILYPLCRGDFHGFFIQAISGICTCGFLNIFIFPFTYNTKYLERLEDKGWRE